MKSTSGWAACWSTAFPPTGCPGSGSSRTLTVFSPPASQVKLNTKVGEGEYTMERLREEYDAVYIAIGAHTDKKVGIDGEDAKDVLSAVEFLGNIGDDQIPDFTGKKVCIIGGGNVAMDCTRSAIRCGAERVSIVYRRRKEDMTALAEEVDGAIAEGAVMMDLHAPLRIETDDEGKVAALWVSPKIPGKIRDGRVSPAGSGLEDKRIECDVVIAAVGQGIDFHTLEFLRHPGGPGGSSRRRIGQRWTMRPACSPAATVSPAPRPPSGPLPRAKWRRPISTTIWAITM